VAFVPLLPLCKKVVCRNGFSKNCLTGPQLGGKHCGCGEALPSVSLAFQGPHQSLVVREGGEGGEQIAPCRT